MNEWIAGWIGAWLGSPVLGHWGQIETHVYVIPALLGGLYRRVRGDLDAAGGIPGGPATLQQNPIAPLDLKKAS